MVKICLTLGIKGKCFFSNYMSIPEQFYFDILHCDFHGTGEFCIKAWCTNYKEPVKSSNKSTNSGLSKNQTHRTQYYLNNEKKKKLDDLAVMVNFPSEIFRYQRKITENLGDLKGNEFKNIIFYLGPIFKKVLKKNVFEHWAAYVTALRILCQTKISKEDLNDAFILLDYFVRRFSNIYGKHNMNYKVHVHLHYAMQVLLFGSLIYVTCFIFEGKHFFPSKLYRVVFS